MMEHNRFLRRGWLVSLLVAAFVAVNLFIFHSLWHEYQSHQLIPGTLVSVVFFLAVAKHIGLLAVLLRRFRSAFHRGRRSGHH